MLVGRLLWIDRATSAVTRRELSELADLIADDSGWLWLDIPEPDDEAIGRLGGSDQSVDTALADSKDAYDRLSKITASQLAFLAGATEYHRARTDMKITIAAGTLPITAISSVVGTNVISNDVTRWRWLGGLILVMLALSLVLLRRAKRQGWW